MNRKHIFVLLFLLAGAIACKKEMIESFEGFKNPAGFPEPVYHFATNPVTKDGFELGRKLFYDTRLSVNNTISCGNCHIQTSGFTHHGHNVSHGIFDRLGTRNSPAIMNLAWSTHFMWDGGIFDLDLQPIAPITNHVEMGETVVNVVNKLKEDAEYPSLFEKAFGSREISNTNFLKAMSQFMVMCVSNNAKYDSVTRNQAVFTEDEQNGYTLFKQKCNSCHTEPLFTDQSFRNNGLPVTTRNDMGRFAVTLQEQDKLKFKVPSLRNLSFTPPYMHDGRFLTIDAVLEHYNAAVQITPTLDPQLQQPGHTGIAMSAEEKRLINTFLKTLDDRVFITDRRFSEQ